MHFPDQCPRLPAPRPLCTMDCTLLGPAPPPPHTLATLAQIHDGNLNEYGNQYDDDLHLAM